MIGFIAISLLAGVAALLWGFSAFGEWWYDKQVKKRDESKL